jgi:DNA-binding NtrC family response regulator
VNRLRVTTPATTALSVASPSGGTGLGRILFVDDEVAVLDGLKRAIRSVPHPTWEIHFATGAGAALALFREQAFQVIVTDMHMPGMNGADLLSRIAVLDPDCIRIMLTGQADLETALAAVNQGSVFRLLLKPCDRHALIAAIGHALHQHSLQTAERRLLRAQLEHAQKLAGVGRCAAGIVHDLDRVLRCIADLSGELRADDRAKTLGQINAAATQAANLTRELLGFCPRDDERNT